MGTTFLIIWISGLIPDYLAYRWWWKTKFDWTTGDRIFALSFIWMSWAGVIASLICYFSERTSYNNEKANW